jgi:hypothetical protein
MNIRRIAPVLVSLGSLIAGSGAPIQAQVKDTVIEGQVKIGVHKIKFDANTPYHLEVKSKNFFPSLILPNTFLPNRADFKERNVFRSLYMPSKSSEQTLIVLPNVYGSAIPEGVLDYTLTVKALMLDETPVLKKEDKISEDDPRYAASFYKTRHRAYPIKLTKGKTYIIDMARAGADNKLDPFLYVENPMKQVIAQDDESGGYPNARILLRAAADGEYRLIASGQSDQNGLGAFTLTVRTLKDEK